MKRPYALSVSIGPETFNGNRPPVFGKPYIMDNTLAHIPFPHLFLPDAVGIPRSLNPYELRSGELHAAPEYSARHKDGSYRRERNASGMKCRQFPAVPHDAQYDDGRKQKDRRQNLRHDGGQSGTEIFYDKHHSRIGPNKDINALHKLRKKIKAESEAHNDEQQPRMTEKDIAEKKCHRGDPPADGELLRKCR